MHSRQEVIASADVVVVKVGTNVLADAAGHLHLTRIQELADQIERLYASGRKVVLVSSGAIGAGMGRLGLRQRPTELPQLQACAAVGQCRLMQLYQESFARHGRTVGQILLTASDFESRQRYLNVRNTIRTLFEYGAVPIINENDTVSVAEIQFGDNDHLAALVTNLLCAPLLVLLTNVDGLYSDDPQVNGQAQLMRIVPRIDASVTRLAAASRSALGSGGMSSKLRAARLVTAAGEAVIMANGAIPSVLDRIFAAEEIGTLFLPHGGDLQARKRWLGLTVRPKGSVRVDRGAERAVLELGKSLLPVGILAVEGTFGKGDVISICNAQGQEIARGLSNYSSADAERLAGLSSTQILERFGRMPYAELVHRDNLVITGQ